MYAISQTKNRVTIKDMPFSQEESLRRQIAENCPYAFYFKDVTFHVGDGGVLLLRGRVPSFYLKQILQTLVKKLDGVDQIDNQVEVVIATGLSSKKPR